MTQMILDSTPQAQWQLLVHEAQASCDRQLDESLESYLVFLLMRFTRKPHCMARVMAEDYLKAFACRRSERIDRLRDVGDHCLLYSGLFPQQAERRLVSISYFVNLGQSAYMQLSGLLDQGWALVYGHLSEAFVVLVDILQAMRELDGHAVLTPIQAMEFWQDTGSRRSYQQISAVHSRAVPMPGSRQTH
jgi:hypothetical protein